jgi:hypothetical protein
MSSPYKNKKTEKWKNITSGLIKNHPLNEKEIVKAVLESWDQIFSSKLGNYNIGKEIFPTPQIMSFLLHELVAHNLRLKHPGKYRVGTEKFEKDVVYEKDGKYSVEIKGSSHPNQVFGNRSYAQPNSKDAIKKKDGYYITINFEKFTKNRKKSPRVLLIRFGYIEHTDWIAQNSPTGQQARLTSNAYKYKLKVIYNVNDKTKKE